MKERSSIRLVHGDLDFKHWMDGMPSVDDARPASCPCCGRASREPGRGLGLHGHGLRDRQVRGPVEHWGRPKTVIIAVRRYQCQRCSAVILVVPRGIVVRRLFSSAAIALALWLYHQAQHAGLLGRSPESVWGEASEERRADDLDEAKLREALTVRENRRVRRDTTVSIAGGTYELDQGFLAGRIVTVGYCVLDDPLEPWIELDGKSLGLHLVDPARNAHRERPPRGPGQERSTTEGAAVSFRPADALLDRALGRTPRAGGGEQR